MRALAFSDDLALTDHVSVPVTFPDHISVALTDHVAFPHHVSVPDQHFNTQHLPHDDHHAASDGLTDDGHACGAV